MRPFNQIAWYDIDESLSVSQSWSCLQCYQISQWAANWLEIAPIDSDWYRSLVWASLTFSNTKTLSLLHPLSSDLPPISRYFNWERTWKLNRIENLGWGRRKKGGNSNAKATMDIERADLFVRFVCCLPIPFYRCVVCFLKEEEEVIRSYRRNRRTT